MDDDKVLDQYREIAEEMLHPLATQDEVDEAYKRMSPNYHEDIKRPAFKYGAPRNIALEVQKLYPNDKNIRILDTSAGTGIVGENLKALGYKNIDGLEPSDALFNKAKELKIYENYFSDYLGSSELPISDDTYDIITSCGSFYVTHVRGDCFPELIRITKPGGHIVILTGEEDSVAGEAHTEYIAGLDKLAALLQGAGKWKQIQRTTLPVPEYYHDDRGALFVYQVL